MKTQFLHKIALLLLLVTSLNFAMDSFPTEGELEAFNLEQNDSEKEVEDIDLDKKETITPHKLQFSQEFTPRKIVHIEAVFSPLEHFEKIPTPPPEA